MKEDQRDQKTAQVDRYNDEANQALLKVMRGCEVPTDATQTTETLLMLLLQQERQQSLRRHRMSQVVNTKNDQEKHVHI